MNPIIHYNTGVLLTCWRSRQCTLSIVCKGGRKKLLPKSERYSFFVCFLDVFKNTKKAKNKYFGHQTFKKNIKKTRIIHYEESVCIYRKATNFDKKHIFKIFSDIFNRQCLHYLKKKILINNFKLDLPNIKCKKICLNTESIFCTRSIIISDA